MKQNKPSVASQFSVNSTWPRKNKYFKFKYNTNNKPNAVFNRKEHVQHTKRQSTNIKVVLRNSKKNTFKKHTYIQYTFTFKRFLKKIHPVQNMEKKFQVKMHLHSYLLKGQYAELVPSNYNETSKHSVNTVSQLHLIQALYLPSLKLCWSFM